MNIDDLTLEQLLDLNALVCRRIDELRARQDLQVLVQLHIGQQVQFEGHHGLIVGTVIKINRKTVIVLSDDKRQWKVPANMIRIVKDCSEGQVLIKKQ